MQTVKTILKYVLAVLFVAAGVNHFRAPAFYVNIMPPYLPWHLFLVYLSGVFEVALGIMLLIPKLARWAGWGMIALLIAVFPANLHMAMNPDLYADVPRAGLYLRLPLQAVLIAWAYWYTRPDGAPRGRDEPALT